MFLAGDIGGTNTRLALFADKGAKPLREATFPSQEYGSLEAVLRDFLSPPPPVIAAACFGIAGPVIGGRCITTNLPWVVDERVVARKIGIAHVRLVNDLVALGYGAVLAPRSRLVSLNGDRLPSKKGANLAILAAGTGLGESALVWDGRRFVPVGTEGGHGDFAPRNALEIKLLEFLTDRFGRVSYERILSGPGLRNLYEFFRDGMHLTETESNHRAIESAEDGNVAILELGLADKSAPAREAVRMFVRIYGAETGNLCLRYLAVGGVFVAGSIAVALRERLVSREFREALTAKGRFSPMVAETPVALVLDKGIGIRGAAAFARSLV